MATVPVSTDNRPVSSANAPGNGHNLLR